MKCNSCGIKERVLSTLSYIGKGGEKFSAVAMEDVTLKAFSWKKSNYVMYL